MTLRVSGFVPTIPIHVTWKSPYTRKAVAVATFPGPAFSWSFSITSAFTHG